MMNTVLRRLSALAVVALVGGGAAYAAAVPSGATLTAWLAGTRGTATAYDSTNHVYLVVGAYGAGGLRGRFVSSNGSPVGNPFVIQTSANWTHFPRVAFSPDADGGAGGFLVTWHESDLAGGNTSTHGRMVSFGKSGPYGSDNVLQNEGSWWEAGAAAAYAAGSHEFLVAWRKIGTYGIRAVRVDNNAAPKDAVFTIIKTGQFEDNPSIGYNPNKDQFLVAYSGYNGTANFAYVDCRLVQAGANQILGASASRLATAAGTYITDTTYNPRTDQFLVAWYDGYSEGRLVASDATPIGNMMTLSTRWRANDGLSVAYNVISNTFFMVAATPLAYDDGGVELVGSTGVPVDNGFLVTNSGANGNFYPRIAASTDDPNWLISTAHSFSSTMVQLISGTASGDTTPIPTGPAPTPQPVSSPLLNVDTPSANAAVSTAGFLIAGWALDKGATSGTGIDVVAVWAYPSTGAAAILAGTATLGYQRPDVGAFFGSQFTPSGFGLQATLPAGAYTLAVYGHSTVNGAWSSPTLVKVTVQGPVSTPRMWVDFPSQNQMLSQSITVGGWAIDLGAPSDTGVDAVHVWAYPSGGGAAIWVGAASYGRSRPDVAAAFGSSRYDASGFLLQGGTLPPGSYTLVVFAHSTVSGNFNPTLVTITVH